MLAPHFKNKVHNTPMKSMLLDQKSIIRNRLIMKSKDRISEFLSRQTSVPYIRIICLLRVEESSLQRLFCRDFPFTTYFCEIEPLDMTLDPEIFYCAFCVCRRDACFELLSVLICCSSGEFIEETFQLEKPFPAADCFGF
jgi:hypothetical protein